MNEQLPEASESHESLLGMTEVDPSPEESPEYISKDEYFPESSDRQPSPPARTHTLGLGNHGPVYWCRCSPSTSSHQFQLTSYAVTRIHKYSSFAFTAFAALHITNTSLLPLLTRSIPASDTYLLLTRPYYQSQPLETFLIAAPLWLHVGSGVALRLYRRRVAVERYGAEDKKYRRRVAWPALSGTSALGYAMVPLVAGHVFVNRILPLYYEGGNSNIGLEYVSHGFARFPAISYAAFTALVSIGVWHMVWGMAKWQGLTPAYVKEGGEEGQVYRKRRFYGVNGVAALITGLWLSGGLGVIGRGGPAIGWLAKNYDELFRKIPIVGNWL
ncbi:hypothetical protein LTS18_012986 [Coniosporium uncinatum]|uniref:Uncharacterized protein n=1 Tax=Coniosporium uncinatum TaxID=93489 RepID=A0ACC3DIJ0_9PEZI|nr:hypothetical protein LTS18_012986 [Coniosporium uncinatum]